MTLPLMLFAAGKGTRMRPLTNHLPKPLVEVGGKALIDHALEVARAAGAGPVVVNLHYLGAQIEAHLQGQDLRFSREESLLLETGGGLRAALPLLGEGPVLVLNSDAVWTGQNPLTQLLGAWSAARMDALLVTLPAKAAMGHQGPGDFICAPSGRLSRANGAPGVVYLGAQILKTQDLAAIAEPVFSLNRIWDRMIARGTLFGLDHQGGWCDVGRPESIATAETLLKAHDE